MLTISATTSTERGLAMMSVEVVGAVVMPSIAHSSPGYVTNVLAVATGSHAPATSA